jgi:ubiquinone/menaquinone biosynthesis C-methylase UbiE
MGFWNRIAASLYDHILSPFEKSWFGERRSCLLRRASGAVLEIGGGTGINLPCYSGVEKVVFTDPDQHMLRQAEWKLKRARVPVLLGQARAEALPFAENSFDTVVATLVFCTVQSPQESLKEVRRVIRPDGRLLLLEHVLGEGNRAVWQNRLTPVWSKVSMGCHLNRDTVDQVQGAGFEFESLEQYEPPALPRLTRPAVVGVARPTLME